MKTQQSIDHLLSNKFSDAYHPIQKQGPSAPETIGNVIQEYCKKIEYDYPVWVLHAKVIFVQVFLTLNHKGELKGSMADLKVGGARGGGFSFLKESCLRWG